MQLVWGPLVTGCSCCVAAVRETQCWAAQATMLQEHYYGSEDRYLEQTPQSVRNIIVSLLYIVFDVQFSRTQLLRLTLLNAAR